MYVNKKCMFLGSNKQYSLRLGFFENVRMEDEINNLKHNRKTSKL